MTNNLIYTFLLLILTKGDVSAQIWNDTLHTYSRQEIPEEPSADTLLHLYPLTRDLKGNYPYKLEVEGVITKVSSGLHCGVICGCGTIRVQLSGKITDYQGMEVFIALPCYIPPDYLNRKIKIKVKQLTTDNKDCFWNEAPFNTIDSQGVPFYIPADLNERWKVE